MLLQSATFRAPTVKNRVIKSRDNSICFQAKYSPLLNLTWRTNRGFTKTTPWQQCFSWIIITSYSMLWTGRVLQQIHQMPQTADKINVTLLLMIRRHDLLVLIRLSTSEIEEIYKQFIAEQKRQYLRCWDKLCGYLSDEGKGTILNPQPGSKVCIANVPARCPNWWHRLWPCCTDSHPTSTSLRKSIACFAEVVVSLRCLQKQCN